MSLASVVNMIYGQVPSATPAQEGALSFYPWDSEGGAPPLEERVEGDSGCFDVVVTALPQDDGAAAVSAFRYRAGLAVRVWYQRGAEFDRRMLQGAIAADCAAIISRVANPNNWTTATGLDALLPAGAPTTQVLHQGAVALVSIPFTAVYYEG